MPLEARARVNRSQSPGAEEREASGKGAGSAYLAGLNSTARNQPGSRVAGATGFLGGATEILSSGISHQLHPRDPSGRLFPWGQTGQLGSSSLPPCKAQGRRLPPTMGREVG